MDITLDMALLCNTLSGNGKTGFAGRANNLIINQLKYNLNSFNFKLNQSEKTYFISKLTPFFEEYLLVAGLIASISQCKG